MWTTEKIYCLTSFGKVLEEIDMTLLNWHLRMLYLSYIIGTSWENLSFHWCSPHQSWLLTNYHPILIVHYIYIIYIWYNTYILYKYICNVYRGVILQQFRRWYIRSAIKSKTDFKKNAVRFILKCKNRIILSSSLPRIE